MSDQLRLVKYGLYCLHLRQFIMISFCLCSMVDCLCSMTEIMIFPYSTYSQHFALIYKLSSEKCTVCLINWYPWNIHIALAPGYLPFTKSIPSLQRSQWEYKQAQHLICSKGMGVCNMHYLYLTSLSCWLIFLLENKMYNLCVET